MFPDESLCSIPVKPSGGVADTGEVDAGLVSLGDPVDFLESFFQSREMDP